jgi:SAM-dependent methyltransferase
MHWLSDFNHTSSRLRWIREREKKMNDTDTPWYETFFGEDYLRIYEPILTPERTRREVDAVINMFTAFGYLESQDEDQQVLKQVYKALKPGGHFLLETMHPEALIRHFSPHMIEHYPEGLIVLEERNFDLLTSRANVKITMIYPNGQRKEYGHAARVYSLTELAQMLAVAGLQVKAYYGAWDGSKLTIDSFRLILLAQKVE